MQHSKWLFTATIMLLCVLLGFVFLKSTSDTEVSVKNTSEQPVHVVASWREQEMSLGELKPDSQLSFSVKDEAAMTFAVTLNDGRVIETQGVYFTNGTTIVVEINHYGVDVDSYL